MFRINKIPVILGLRSITILELLLVKTNFIRLNTLTAVIIQTLYYNTQSKFNIHTILIEHVTNYPIKSAIRYLYIT